MMRDLRILFVTPCWPIGRMFGGQLRSLQTARALAHVGKVDVLVVGSEAGDVEAAKMTAEEFRVLPSAPATVSAGRTPWERVRWAVDLHYLDIHGYVVSEADRARILALRSHYDLVWAMNARTPNLLQIWDWPHTHLDLDDIPSAYFRGVAETGGPSLRQYKALLHRLLLYRRERALVLRFTTLSVCSDADRAYLGGLAAHVIPNGFDAPAHPPVRAPAQPPRLGFIGLLTYAPNADAMQWFLEGVWPLIRAAVPDACFRAVGRGTEALTSPATAVSGLGWLNDPADEIASWSVMVIPIRFGGGTRIKVAEAFSRKCPVVATRFGAYGYDVSDGHQLRLADEPGRFAAACIELLRNPAGAATMAERARRDFLARWTWDAIAPRIWAAAEDCLRRSNYDATAPAATQR